MLSGLCILATILGTWGSPQGRLQVTPQQTADHVAFALTYDAHPIGTLCCGRDFRTVEPIEGPQSHRSSWRTVWGDAAIIRDDFTEMQYRAIDATGRDIILEVRAYDEGFACRYRLPAGGVFSEVTRFACRDDVMAWPITGCEKTYPREPSPLRPREGSTRQTRYVPPVTLRSDAGYVSFFEAYAVGYPRMELRPMTNALEVVLLDAKMPVLTQGGATPWRVVQMGRTAAELIDHASLVLNLNPPCVLKDTTWVKPGLTLSNLSNCPLENKALISAASSDAVSLGVRYLQLDWGWYGTERKWSEQEKAQFAKTAPELADEPTWRGNTTGCARKTVHGIVPYHPTWRRRFKVDLDFGTLLPFLAAQGVRVCLYVRGKTLEHEDVDDLFGLYERWGVAGVKPGFVMYGTAAATDWNREVIRLAAKHHLWVDVHDNAIPDGMQRTYPNLFLMEGVGGEEGKHPVHQDVAIPFARGLVGPFDYTPMIFMRDRSHAHGLAMLICYPGPTAVLRGDSVLRNRLTGTTSSFGWGVGEREFIKALPWTWDESRTLDGEIAEFLVTARRSGGDWFVAGLNGDTERTFMLAPSFLPTNQTFRLTLWQDDLQDSNVPCRRTMRVSRQCSREMRLPITMAACGGFIAHFKLLPQPELQEPTLEVIGEIPPETTDDAISLNVAANGAEVMFKVNGQLYDVRVPNAQGRCQSDRLPLKPGENEIRLESGAVTRRYSITRKLRN